MPSDLKPITIYVHGRGPNPKKVIIVLEELNIPYTAIPITNPKEESYTKINPNGRLPAIEDPNTGITLWESGAIIEYLVETYDKDQKLTFSSFPEKWQLRQYLYFQMSGQGPYYGQAAWFHIFHPEPVESAKERYIEQAMRVVGVLDNILADKEYLVGGKCTYADLAFIPWNMLLHHVGDMWNRFKVEETYPNFNKWHQKLLARPAVQKGLQDIPEPETK